MRLKYSYVFFGSAFCLFTPLFILSCSTTKVSIDTNPVKAQVVVKPVGSGSEKTLGETPLVLSASQLEENFGGSGPVVVELKKPGYRTTKILITELSAQDLFIKQDLESLNGLDDPTVVNSHIEKMFEIQRLIRIKRYDDAMKLISELKKEAPFLASIYELEGGILYLKSNYRDALDAYRVAVKINPNSVEAVRMKELLEKQLLPKSELRLPGSVGGSGQ